MYRPEMGVPDAASAGAAGDSGVDGAGDDRESEQADSAQHAAAARAILRIFVGRAEAGGAQPADCCGSVGISGGLHEGNIKRL